MVELKILTPRRDNGIREPVHWKRRLSGGTYHHMIPYSLLRDVWNRLVDLHVGTRLPLAPVAIRRLLLLSDRRQTNVDGLIARMPANYESRSRSGQNKPEPLDHLDALKLQTAAVWAAWNTVEGPSARSDDKTDQDRRLDRFVGVAPEYSRTIDTLYEHFQAFADSPGSAQLPRFANVLSSARLVVYRDEPIPYSASMWVQEPGGLWRKRRDGETITGEQDNSPQSGRATAASAER